MSPETIHYFFAIQNLLLIYKEVLKLIVFRPLLPGWFGLRCLIRVCVPRMNMAGFGFDISIGLSSLDLAPRRVSHVISYL
jgi:hypothetical protein